MLAAGLWGLLGGVALVLGAVVGLWVRVPTRAIGLIMAFGAGVLVSALAFDLTEEAYKMSGSVAVVIGLAVGGISFYAADSVVDRRGGAHRKRSGGQQAEGSGTAILIGALMDGIPESVAIGVSLVGGGKIGIAVVAAVFLSNVPESLSAATGMKAAGTSRGRVLAVWTAVMLVSGVSSALGFLFLGDASPTTIAFILAFAAGAILTMLTDTMFPEAFENGGGTAGLVTVLGFTAAFMLSTLE